MRTLVIITCAAACLIAVGCNNQWDLKWPTRSAAPEKPEGGTTASPPADPGPMPTTGDPQQDIAQLQQQVRTLQLKVRSLEDENKKLRESNASTADLRKALEEKTFTAQMQAEDLKVLKTAAVERDFHKTRADRLERELRDLNARVARLLKNRGVGTPGTDPGKTSPIKPDGQ